MQIGLAIVALVLLAISVLPLVPTDLWWVRVTDFPRLQLLIAIVASTGLLILIGGWRSWLLRYALVGLLVNGLYHLVVLAPLIFPGEKVPDCRDETFRVMVANVQRGNRNADKLIDILRNVQPDILVAQETDEWWDRQLSALSDLYPYTEAVITGSYYGMHLFSRSQILEAEVVYPTNPETPAIVARVALPGGAINLIGLHPRPPHPQQSTTPRDAELLWAALHVQRGTPTILAGDLNAVPWEGTVARMRRVARLLDPRRTAGFLATFDAKSWWMKWPLDQILYTGELNALKAEVHVPFGSDHRKRAGRPIAFRPSADALAA